MELPAYSDAVLTPDLIDFLLGPVSITVGSRDAERVPSMSRSYGCEISSDRREVRLFVSASRAKTLLRDLRAGGAIAAVFSRPTTHQTIQIKGYGARIEPVQADDHALIERHGERTARELIAIGYPYQFSRAVMALVDIDAVRVCFIPEFAFDQTPGQGAGRPLVARA